MHWTGWRRHSLIAVALVVGIGLFVVAYGWLPWLVDGSRLRRLSPKDQAGILGNDRGDVLKIVAGAGAVVALLYTARKHNLDRKAHALSEQGQVTDRYTKAIAQLASDKLSERLGGIYALERIMADSARDHPTVVEVLAAFVRDRAPLASAQQQGVPPAIDKSTAFEPGEDIRAAMTVLARRPDGHEPFDIDLRRTTLAGLELPQRARFEDVNFQFANLSRASLVMANLNGADLVGANLVGTRLTAARLNGALLMGARLVAAQLNAASLIGADFISATLTGANLTNARLARADFTKATLMGANLTDARLNGADLRQAALSGTTGLEASQLATALLSDSTDLDEVLAADSWVQARIDACRDWRPGDPIPSPTPQPAAT